MARGNLHSNVSNRFGTMGTPAFFTSANPGVHLSICGNHGSLDIVSYGTLSEEPLNQSIHLARNENSRWR
jgi:hypothetical protein